MASNIQKWMDSLTPEQLAAHKAKMAQGRKRYRELKKAEETPESTQPQDPTPPPSSTPQAPVAEGTGHVYFAQRLSRPQAISPEYAQLFRKLLGEYLDILACQTGGGTYTTDYCRLCVQTGVHVNGAPCGCPCHRARGALAGFDERGL